MTKTPEYIDTYSLSQIAALATDSPGLPKAAARLRIIQMLFDVLGFDLANDAALMLASEPIAKLCVATAGAGKTTNANIQIIEEKIIRKSRRDPEKNLAGDKVLCLVYNKHNVNDFKRKHQQMISRLRMANIKGLDIDDDLQVSTMHAFCDMWRRNYSVECDMVGYKIAKEEQSLRLMKTAISAAYKKHGIQKADSANVQDYYTLYSYAKESMLEFCDLGGSDKFIDLKQSAAIVEDVFKFYEMLKHTKRLFDFSDMLVKVYHLLNTRKDILQNVQRFYEFVVVDELQDFTPIMMSILQLLVNNNTPLLCIGDDDQSIYGFRGADIYNTLNFDEKFTGGEIYSLNTNRRCRDNILDLAKKIINSNQMRYSKNINGIKPGGTVKFVPYNSIDGEIFNIINVLKKYSVNDLQSTVICYRNQESSIILSQLLSENAIPHNIISGYHAYSHELYRHVLDILLLLSRPMDMYAQLNLYKILPIKKEAIMDILGYNPASNSFKDDVTRKHFSQIDFGQYLSYRNFTECLAVLTKISQIIATEPLKVYMPVIWEYLCKYFWNLKKTFNNNNGIDDLFEVKVYKTFNSDLTYAQLYNRIESQKNMCRKNQEARKGVTLSTFHGLKGLEYNNVFMIDLSNDITPNTKLINDKPYSSKLKQSLKEAETRLFYVAMTRAIDNLFLYYLETNPSSYVDRLMSDSSNVHNDLLDLQSDLADSDISLTFDSNLDSSEIDLLMDDDLLSSSEKHALNTANKSIAFTQNTIQDADIQLCTSFQAESSNKDSMPNVIKTMKPKSYMQRMLDRV